MHRKGAKDAKKTLYYKETGLITWKLHLDIRSPKEDNNCDKVKGFEYDNSKIVISNGRSQAMDIPIILNPNEKSADSCKGDYATEPISSDDKCVCGEGNRKNCPDDEYNYCVEDKCRKYPKCVEENNKACVCSDSLSNIDKYDCGYDSSKDDDFVGLDTKENPEYNYCINKECLKEISLEMK